MWNEGGVYPTCVRAEDLGGWREVRKRRRGDGSKGRQIGRDRTRERHTAGERQERTQRWRQKQRQGEAGRQGRQTNGETERNQKWRQAQAEGDGEIRDGDTQGTDTGTGDRAGRRKAQEGHWKCAMVGVRLVPSPLSKPPCCLNRGERETT